MGTVLVRYVGPHDAVEIDLSAHDEIDHDDVEQWVEVRHGDTVEVLDVIAHGRPGGTGVALVDGEEVSFVYGEEPFGEILIPAAFPTSGLLAQTDNWQPAKAAKAKDSKADDEKDGAL